MKPTVLRLIAWVGSREAGRQVSGYALIGLLQMVLDWGVFVGLTALGVQTMLANPLARAVGAAFGYMGNGWYTFRHPEGPHRLGRGSLARFILLWCGLTLLSTLLLEGIDGRHGLSWAWMLKPAVDLGLAFLAFLASRLWVYR